MSQPTAIVQINTKVRERENTEWAPNRIGHNSPCADLTRARFTPFLPSSFFQSTVTPAPNSTLVRDDQVQFEMDRNTAASVLLELEKIEAIMNGAQ